MPTSAANDSQTDTVLKGVVRVEALPTPSEHIPSLMERVKPLYLSRTYGIPLPNKDDPTQGWDSEEFLDKLARKKGRLLKQGEPDLDSVAKIILSDWVRGKIPFFVSPPERPEELNVAEAKAKAKAARDVKGKGKAVEQVPHVKQNLGSIMQKNTFLAEDIKPLEQAEDEEDGDSEEQGVGRDEGSESESESEDGEEELKWTDVFEGIKGSTDNESHSTSENSDEETRSSDNGRFSLSCLAAATQSLTTDNGDVTEDVEEAVATKAGKGPRMTTNKASILYCVIQRLSTRLIQSQRKASNFYTTANVKNKNREKAALLKSLPVGKKGEARKRRKSKT